MIAPEEFLKTVRKADDSDDIVIRMGTIPGGYAGGRPTVQFDGESIASTKTYPYLGSYTPTAGDRVLLVRAGHTWVVLGEII